MTALLSNMGEGDEDKEGGGHPVTPSLRWLRVNHQPLDDVSCHNQDPGVPVSHKLLQHDLERVPLPLLRTQAPPDHQVVMV